MIVQETIDVVEQGIRNENDVFKDMILKNTSQTSLFRMVSWLLSCGGHFLLFMPIINMLAWIPLVGYFLATMFSVAALLIALIWSTIMHFLVLGLAWVYYRPIFGVTMLTLVVVGCGVLLFSDLESK